jgi:hypothetical protein
MTTKRAGIRRAKKKMGRIEKKRTPKTGTRKRTRQLIEKKTGQNKESRKQKKT